MLQLTQKEEVLKAVVEKQERYVQHRVQLRPAKYESCGDLIMSCFINMTQLEVDHEAASRLLLECCAACCPQPLSALSLWRSSEVLSSGIRQFDAALPCGGISGGGITEFVGPSGVGKTQFCFSLAARSLLNSLGGEIVWIDTEGAFSARRMKEVLQGMGCDEPTKVQRRCGGIVEETAGGCGNRPALSRLRVVRCGSLDEVIRTVGNLQMAVGAHEANGEAEGASLRLLVIDSVAAPARRAYRKEEGPHRQLLLNRLAEYLKRTATRVQIPLVVTNQISGRELDANEDAAAALGNIWYHGVNMRLTLTFEDGEAHHQGGGIRRLHITKSPSCGPMSMAYEIGVCGVRGVERDE